MASLSPEFRSALEVLSADFGVTESYDYAPLRPSLVERLAELDRRLTVLESRDRDS